MFAKNTFKNIIILLSALVFQITYGNSNHQWKVINEILEFCFHGGHKFITILDQVDVPNFRTSYSLALNSKYNFRSRFITNENLVSSSYIEVGTSNYIGNLDFLIVDKTRQDEARQGKNFSDILEIISARKIQKSALIINENEVEELKVL